MNPPKNPRESSFPDIKRPRTDVEHVTEWSPCNEMLKTQWGTISYREWCGLEAKRMARGASIFYVAFDLTGNCAIARG